MPFTPTPAPGGYAQNLVQIGQTVLGDGVDAARGGMSVYKNPETGGLYAFFRDGSPAWSGARQGGTLENWNCVFPQTTRWINGLVNNFQQGISR